VTESTKVHTDKRPGCTRRRLITVVAAVLAAVAVFYVETLVLRLDLATPALGSRASTPVTIDNVTSVAIITSVLAWMGMAMLEGMNIPKPRYVWTVIAVLVFLGSLAGPFTGTGITTTARLGLAALHLVMAAILIPQIPDWPRRRDQAAGSA
jgi:hypothetical protein